VGLNDFSSRKRDKQPTIKIKPNMKTYPKICFTKQAYLHPEVEIAEVALERGFADSIEVVGKDQEVEF
jgi:hypothetical protein